MPLLHLLLHLTTLLHLLLHLLHTLVQLVTLLLGEHIIHFRLHERGQRGNFTGQVAQLLRFLADRSFIKVRLDLALHLLLQRTGFLAQFSDLTLHLIDDRADFLLLVFGQPHHLGQLVNLIRLPARGLLGHGRNGQAQGNQCGTKQFSKFHKCLRYCWWSLPWDHLGALVSSFRTYTLKHTPTGFHPDQPSFYTYFAETRARSRHTRGFKQM